MKEERYMGIDFIEFFKDYWASLTHFFLGHPKKDCRKLETPLSVQCRCGTIIQLSDYY